MTFDFSIKNHFQIYSRILNQMGYTEFMTYFKQCVEFLHYGCFRTPFSHVLIAEFRDVQLSDRGWYFCEARGRNGRVVEKDVQVPVRGEQTAVPLQGDKVAQLVSCRTSNQ